MTGEVHGSGPSDFYTTPAGQMAARLVRERLRALWPGLPRGTAVLGLGQAAPYLDLWRGQEGGAARLVALHPAQLGLPLRRWPPDGGPGASAVGEGRSLPFPDLCFDRVLLIHGLEAAESARCLLRETWRVLKDDGRLLVVVPNRRGLWAHVEATPFGTGQPYSPGQLGRLLARQMFQVERRDAALFVPPFRRRLLLRGAELWERAGRALCPPRFAGLVIVEARKTLFAAVPTGSATTARRRVRVMADAA